MEDIKIKAKNFAINAHMGQVRKNEVDKPMIVHPIGVGELLESYGYDDNVVAAGYLHDVVEDTKYTLDDIRCVFGDDIASLVDVASEPDKSLSWEERKRHTIENTRTLPFRQKLVICVDKINNLEDLYLKFEKTGKRDFSAFNRGEEKQKWYYIEIYKSLIDGEDETLPIFVRLKNVIDKVYGEVNDNNTLNEIFENDIDYYTELKKLHAMKEELIKLKQLSKLEKPYIIEFSGTPRTGKTSTINNLYDFFKKGGFNVRLIEEFTTSKRYREYSKNKYKDLNIGDKNIAIAEEVYKELLDASASSDDIILIDRSLNDRQIWNYLRYLTGDIEHDKYFELREKYFNISKNLIDSLAVMYADSFVALKRDYLSSLSLEERSFLNERNISDFNKSLMGISDLFRENIDNFVFIDTSNISMRDSSVLVARSVMTDMRKKYIKSFKDRYGIK